MSSLPEDLLFTILCLLPVKSLTRFKCVSKRFCSTIESKHFIQFHLRNNSVDSKTKLKIVDPSCDRISSFSLATPDGGSEELKSPFGCGQTRILGCCNGLLCILKWDDSSLRRALPRKKNILPKIALWNPSTKKSHIICIAPIEVAGRGDQFGSVEFGYAFGHDSVKEDYKVLRIVKITTGTQGMETTDVMVYSLKTNSWSAIDIAHARYYRIGDIISLESPNEYMADLIINYRIHSFLHMLALNQEHKYVLAHNAFHWWLYPRNESNKIIAFNLERQEFCKLPLPNLEGYYDSTLGVLGQCLCLKSACRDSFDIWMMKEYGIKDSWVKLFSLRHWPSEYRYITHELSSRDQLNKIPKNRKLAAFSKDDDDENFLLQHLSDRVLMWYDLKRNKYECVSNPAGSSHFYTIESLVPPAGDARNKTNRKKRRRDETSVN